MGPIFAKLEKLLLFFSFFILILTLPLLIYRFVMDENPLKPINGGSEILKSRISSEALSTLEDPNRLASYLLVDSILTIVQSYYVDRDRVSTQDLLKGTLESLSWIPSVHITEEKVGTFQIKLENQPRLSLEVNNLSYNELLDSLVKLGDLFEKKSTETGSFSESSPEKEKHSGLSIVLNAMLASLDSHSALLDPSEYQELKEGTEGSFGGLGVMVGIRDDLLTVLKPLPRSPASRVGISKQDRIIAINGNTTFGFSLNDLITIMRGPPGSSVDLTLLRKGKIAPFDIHLTREIIMVDSVESRLLKHGQQTLLYLRIDNFSMRTNDETSLALKIFKNNYRGIVLDLRANPGGLLDQAIKVADLFLKDGGIVSTRGRKSEKEFATKGNDELHEPIFVLIDEESASASEIVAGALQDNHRAIVIGVPSYGKASVQTVFELPEEAALKLTIARYYTPSDRSIQNVGIVPDIWLQPIFEKTKNENLFGNLRYKNERFLNRNLKTLNVKELQSSLYKGYYLAGPTSERDEKDTISTELIANLVANIDKFTKKEFKSEDFLKQKNDIVLKFIQEKNTSVSKELQQKFGVSWPLSQEEINIENLSFDLPSKKFNGTPGSEITVPFKIGSPRPLTQVSVFIRSQMLAMDTFENLLGNISEDFTSDLKFELPTFITPGQYKVEIGLAIGGQSISETSQMLVIEISEAPRAEVLAKVSLVEEQGGLISGELEPKEKARIKIEIRNQSKVEAHQVECNLMNLAGDQLSIVEDSLDYKLGDLKPGEKKDVFINIHGAKTVISKNLALGVSLKSKDLFLPYRKEFSINAVPNIRK